MGLDGVGVDMVEKGEDSVRMRVEGAGLRGFTVDFDTESGLYTAIQAQERDG